MEHFFVRQLIGEADIETGGNIQLHQDWLPSVLKHTQETSPIIFRIDFGNKSVYTGINKWHTFLDPDYGNRIVYLPKWMILYLNLGPIDIIRLVPDQQVIPGNYIKIRTFSELVNNPDKKEYLESKLKHFTCLTKGHELLLGEYPVYIMEVNKDIPPSVTTVCITNSDLEIEFETPDTDLRASNACRDSTDLRASNACRDSTDLRESLDSGKFIPFSGHGYRLSD
jgi:hypothetical protein